MAEFTKRVENLQQTKHDHQTMEHTRIGIGKNSKQQKHLTIN